MLCTNRILHEHSSQTIFKRSCMDLRNHSHHILNEYTGCGVQTVEIQPLWSSWTTSHCGSIHNVECPQYWNVNIVEVNITRKGPFYESNFILEMFTLLKETYFEISTLWKQAYCGNIHIVFSQVLSGTSLYSLSISIKDLSLWRF